MRCYGCHKKFNYEKYYGICPKCGCFNQKETREERHGELQERFGGEPVRGNRREYEVPGTGASAKAWSSGTARNHAGKRKTSGKEKGFLAISLAVLILGLAVLASGMVFFSAQRAKSAAETDDTLLMTGHSVGERFEFQQGSLQVLEAKTLAGQETLPELEEGMKLIAIRVAGEGDGEYDDYNRMVQPYLEADGIYRRSLYEHLFEPYGQMLGAWPALEDSPLMGEESFDGWYGFLVEEEVQKVRIWFDAYDWSEWDGGNLLAGHYVDLELAGPETGTEGGETDAE